MFRFAQHDKYAFTLAEVLITLVIVGVIAAITVPLIIENYNKTVLKNQFKKNYSVISSALHKAEEELGWNVQCYYANGYSTVINNECPALWSNFTKHINYMKLCKGNALRDGCIPPEYIKDYSPLICLYSKEYIENMNYVYVLADGTIIILYNIVGTNPLLLVDINGAKKPNEIGKDIISLSIDKSKNALRINDSLTACINSNNKMYFKNLQDILYKD